MKCCCFVVVVVGGGVVVVFPVLCHSDIYISNIITSSLLHAHGIFCAIIFESFMGEYVFEVL